MCAKEGTLWRHPFRCLEVSVLDGFEGQGPSVGLKEGKSFGGGPDRSWSGVRAEGAIGEKNRAIADREETKARRRSGQGDGKSMGMKGALIELFQLAHTSPQTRINGEGPQGVVRTDRKFEMGGFLLKLRDVRIGSASKEKKFIEVPLTNELSVAAGKAGVLDQFAGRKGTQRHNRDTTLF